MISMYRYLTIIFLLLITTFANYSLSRPEADKNRLPLKEFPETLGSWKTVAEDQISESIMAVLKVDDYVSRTYLNEKNESLGFYIGYFNNQREGKQVHSPRQCLPGAGWSIISLLLNTSIHSCATWDVLTPILLSRCYQSGVANATAGKPLTPIQPFDC